MINILRGLLVLATIVGGILWVLLVIAARDFNGSTSGASAGAVRLVVLPVVLIVVLLTVIFPSRRWLLHAGAVVIAVFAVGAALVARQSLIVAGMGLAFAAAWFLFYGLSLLADRTSRARA